jgi:polysaccharide biosynthesis protein PslH
VSPRACCGIAIRDSTKGWRDVRILMLTRRLPYAPNRGDRLRAYHMLRFLRERAEVDLVSLVHDEEEASHLEEMRGWSGEVTPLRVGKLRTHAKAALSLPTRTPLTHATLDAASAQSVFRSICERRPPDVVFSYCSGMARFAMSKPLDRFPFVLDFVDVDSQKWRDLARTTPAPMSWIYRREASTLGAFEAQAARRAKAALVVNQREAHLARELSPDANVQVISNGVEVDHLRPPTPPSGKPRIVFCGVMNYAPNVEGISWFVREVWPRVRASRPDATLAIVGQAPTAGVLALGADPSITVTGTVDDVREWLWDGAVAIAPLHVARGLQNKALEAIAAGLPIVLTDAVAGGLPPVAAQASFVANTPIEFADKVLAVLSLPAEERRAIALSCDLSSLSWARTLEPLWPIFDRRKAQQLTAYNRRSYLDLRIRFPIANP